MQTLEFKRAAKKLAQALIAENLLILFQQNLLKTLKLQMHLELNAKA